MTRLTWTIVLVMSAALLTACSSGTLTGSTSTPTEPPRPTAASVEPGIDADQAQHAINVVLGDDRLADLLASRPHDIARVRTSESTDHEGLVVIAEFNEPLKSETDYPLDRCDIDIHGEPMTGIVWLVDGDHVAAVSPRWGDGIDCGY